MGVVGKPAVDKVVLVKVNQKWREAKVLEEQGVNITVGFTYYDAEDETLKRTDPRFWNISPKALTQTEPKPLVPNIH